MESLHTAGAAPMSLVAVEDEASKGVVGHVLVSPVEIGSGGYSIRLVGVAPVGVLWEYQGQGVGSRLIRAGLEACLEAACAAVVVLGEPGYYSRFGFERASAHGFGNEYGVDEYFMVAELRSEVRDGVEGTVRYRPEFGQMEPLSTACPSWRIRIAVGDFSETQKVRGMHTEKRGSPSQAPLSVAK